MARMCHPKSLDVRVRVESRALLSLHTHTHRGTNNSLPPKTGSGRRDRLLGAALVSHSSQELRLHDGTAGGGGGNERTSGVGPAVLGPWHPSTQSRNLSAARLSGKVHTWAGLRNTVAVASGLALCVPWMGQAGLGVARGNAAARLFGIDST